MLKSSLFPCSISTVGIYFSIILLGLGLSEGQNYIQIKDFLVPSQVPLGGVAHLSCQYDFGEDIPYAVNVYRDRTQFFRYLFGKDPFNTTGFSFQLSGMDVTSSQVTKNELSLVLEITGLEATGLYSCEITTDRTFMTTSSSREMQVVEDPEFLNEHNELLNATEVALTTRQGKSAANVITETTTNSASNTIKRSTLTLSQQQHSSQGDTNHEDSKNNYDSDVESNTASCSKMHVPNLEFFYKRRAQLNLNLLNVIVPFFQSIQRNLSTLVNDQDVSRTFAEYKMAHDSIEDSLVRMEAKIEGNRKSIVKYWNAYEKTEKEFQLLGQALQDTITLQSQM